MNARKEKKESFPHTPIKNKAEKEREIESERGKNQAIAKKPKLHLKFFLVSL